LAKVKKEMAQGFASGELWSVLSDLVDDLNAIKNLANELKADHNALLAKLDADTGVTDTNYATLHTVSAADVVLKTTK
jgi:uncharacterized protein YoaH (UPF0181 family)